MKKVLFVFDPDCQHWTLRLAQGRWAGQLLIVKLSCCQSPLCGCADVTFECRLENSPTDHIEWRFSLDSRDHAISQPTDKKISEESDELAKNVVTEFGDEEWDKLFGCCLLVKRDVIEQMDTTKLESPSLIVEANTNGFMFGYSEVFPFAVCFEFKLETKNWMADEQFCINPKCNCCEVCLEFFHLEDNGRELAPDGEKAPAVRYNYKNGRFKILHQSLENQLPIKALLEALKATHPTSDLMFERHHLQMKNIYLNSVAKSLERSAMHEQHEQVTEEVRVAAKVGRNDPCFCGSGKKFKKCCEIKGKPCKH